MKFHEEHAGLEFPPRKFQQHPFCLFLLLIYYTECTNQDNLIQSLEAADKLPEEAYKRLDQEATSATGENGIDKTLQEYGVDIILGPADSYLPDVTACASKSSYPG